MKSAQTLPWPGLFRQTLVTQAPSSVLLIRLMVGGLFLSEGIQKFLFSEQLGAGRFERIGIPLPEVMGPMVGGFELICGLLVLLGLTTRLACIPLICIMLVALFTTKIAVLLGQDFLIFKVRELSRYGFWSMMHESRNDLCLLLGSIYLLLVGAGKWSLDFWLLLRRKEF
jgi:putative oxidoreductase